MRRIERSLARFAAFLIALVITSGCDAEVRDVGGYRIKDSGYLAPGLTGVEGHVYWLDSERVLFKGARIGDLIDLPDGRRISRPGLHVWNTRTGEVSRYADDVPESGYLCYRKGYITYSALRDGNLVERTGELGKETESVRAKDPSPYTELSRNPVTCRNYIRRHYTEFGVRPLPLFDVGEVLDLGDQHYVEQMRYFRAGKSAPVTLPIDSRKMATAPMYSDFLDAVVVREFRSRTAPEMTERYWIVYRSGRLANVDLPAGPWMTGGTDALPTARGWFMISHAVPVADGAYLVDGTEVVRLIKGYALAFAVSPDGCKVAISIPDSGQVSRAEGRLKAIDLCSRKD